MPHLIEGRRASVYSGVATATVNEGMEGTCSVPTAPFRLPFYYPTRLAWSPHWPCPHGFRLVGKEHYFVPACFVSLRPATDDVPYIFGTQQQYRRLVSGFWKETFGQCAGYDTVSLGVGSRLLDWQCWAVWRLCGVPTSKYLHRAPT